MSYTFTDTELAKQRLAFLADVYGTSTMQFLQDCIYTPLEFAVDLGCGPGCTTHLLADILKIEHVTGLDSSSNFVLAAQQTATPHVSFLVHDVTSVPFPCPAADLLYCRFLLTHLQKPEKIIQHWATQLRPGGVLLIEEVEWIETQHPVFIEYLQIVAAMLAHQQHELYIGPTLAHLTHTGSLQIYMSRVQRLEVSTADAATMFWMNIQSWKQQPFIQQHYAATHIERLQENVLLLAQGSQQGSAIAWGMRQMALERHTHTD